MNTLLQTSGTLQTYPSLKLPCLSPGAATAAQLRLLNPPTQAQPQAAVQPGTHGCERSDTDVKQLTQNTSEAATCTRKKTKQTNQM